MLIEAKESGKRVAVCSNSRTSLSLIAQIIEKTQNFFSFSEEESNNEAFLQISELSEPPQDTKQHPGIFMLSGKSHNSDKIACGSNLDRVYQKYSNNYDLYLKSKSVQETNPLQINTKPFFYYTSTALVGLDMQTPFDLVVFLNFDIGILDSREGYQMVSRIRNVKDIAYARLKNYHKKG
jgi:hypothetical protein